MANNSPQEKASNAKGSPQYRRYRLLPIIVFLIFPIISGWALIRLQLPTYLRVVVGIIVLVILAELLIRALNIKALARVEEFFNLRRIFVYVLVGSACFGYCLIWSLKDEKLTTRSSVVFSVAGALLVACSLGLILFTFKSLMTSFLRGGEGGNLSGLRGIVLSLGLAAGVGVGLLVGLDGWKRVTEYDELLHSNSEKRPDPEVSRRERSYKIITESIGPGTAAGVLVAVFVSVGMIVFVFDHRIAGFMGDAVKVSEQTDKTSKSLAVSIPMVESQLTALLNMVHSMMGVSDKLLRSNADLGFAEAHYIRAWVKNITASDKTDPRLGGILQAIAATYWTEEASDVSRLSFVTNSRNYAAFLICAVKALRALIPSADAATRKDVERVHFYTVTPAGPRCLLNWPQEQGDDQVLVHYQRHFMSAYMLFIRELINDTDQPIVHRRWIWSGSNDDRKSAPELFKAWKHYPPTNLLYGDDADKLFIIGVPLPLKSIGTLKPADTGEELINVESFRWSFSCLFEDRAKAIDFASHEKDIAVQPLFDNEAAAVAVHVKLAKIERELKQELASSLASLATPVRDLGQPRGGEPAALTDADIRKFEGLIDATAEGASTLLRGDDLMVFLQKVEAALCVRHAGDIARSTEYKQLIDAAEEKSVRLRWLQLWTYGRSEPAKFRAYFDESFHSDSGPHFVQLSDLEGRLSPCQTTGPEFALLGIEREGAGTSLDLDLPNGKHIHWMLALRSSISSPWESGEIELVPRREQGSFLDYVNSLKALWDSTRDQSPKSLDIRHPGTNSE